MRSRYHSFPRCTIRTPATVATASLPDLSRVRLPPTIDGSGGREPGCARGKPVQVVAACVSAGLA